MKNQYAGVSLLLYSLSINATIRILESQFKTTYEPNNTFL